MEKPQIFPISENALTISFGNKISAELNNIVLKLSNHFEENPFYGLIETVPAYASLTVFYDVYKIRPNFDQSISAFEYVKQITEKALKQLNKIPKIKTRSLDIPVSFERNYALDLEFVAKNNNLSEEKVIEIYTSQTYRVFMLGFLPGFAYMGEVDERIATPRKDLPRRKVPKGSVGIAGRQTGIYSLESPGGWQIIGRTEIELFTPENKTPTYLQSGDSIKFYYV